MLVYAHGHPEPGKFTNKGVDVIYMVPNTTSLIQPPDQGIVRTFKAHYTWYSMERIINTVEDKRTSLLTENTMKAIKPKTINFCWRKLSRCCAWLHRIYDRASHEGNCGYSLKKKVSRVKDFQDVDLGKFRS